MRAEDAYKIAASKGNIDDLLMSIKIAAEKGLTHLKVPLLNDFQVKGLTDLGYMVLQDHGDDVYVMAGRHAPTHHSIRWNSVDGKISGNSIFGQLR